MKGEKETRDAMGIDSAKKKKPKTTKRTLHRLRSNHDTRFLNASSSKAKQLAKEVMSVVLI